MLCLQMEDIFAPNRIHSDQNEEHLSSQHIALFGYSDVHDLPRIWFSKTIDAVF